MKQLAFYWINNDELVTCTQSNDNSLSSDDYAFIWISHAFEIINNRYNGDGATLSNEWAGIK